MLREQRGWNQQQLASEADMKQARISVLEDVNYSSWSITTLKRLAKAFDVPLSVSFGTFGDTLLEIGNFSRDSLERCNFEEDPAFQVNIEKEVKQTSQAASALTEEMQSKNKQAPVVDIQDYLQSGNQGILGAVTSKNKRPEFFPPALASPGVPQLDRPQAMSGV